MPRRRPLVTHLGSFERLQVGDLLDFGKLNLGTAAPLAIVAASITISKSFHAVLGSPGNTQLETIHGGDEGDVLVLRLAAGSPNISVRDNEGNLRLSGHNAMSGTLDTMVLLFDGTNWLEVASSNNG